MARGEQNNMAKKKTNHGGKRQGAGRKATLENATPVLVRFEEKQLTKLDTYTQQKKLPSRSAALRTMVDETQIEESDDEGTGSSDGSSN
jgi:hypothetical protein